VGGAARRRASGSGQSKSAEARLKTAQKRVAEKIDELADLEAELQDAVIEIDDEWNEKAAAIESVEVPLEKSDITIEDFSVVWLPVNPRP